MGTCSAIIKGMDADINFDPELFEHGLSAEEEERRRKKAAADRRNHSRMYKRRRKALIAAMGGECVECGRKRKLEFHHPDGRDWDVRSMNQWRRIKKYEEEWAAGKIELLCKSCNGGINPKREREEEEEYDEYSDCA